MQTEKNKWVEDVLGSADQIRRADAPDMSAHVLARIKERRSDTILSSSAVWRIAASVALLIAINVGTLYIYSNSQKHEIRMEDATSLLGIVTVESGQADVSALFFGN